MKNKKLRIIQIVISLIIIVVIFFQFKLNDFNNIKISLSFTSISLIVVLLFFALLTRSIRWNYLMNTKSIKIKQTDSFKFLLIGAALNIIMPAGAGDIAKSYFGYKWSGVKERMFSVSLYDKLIAIASLFFLAIFSYFIMPKTIFFLVAIISIMPLVLILFYEKFNKIKLFNKLFTYVNKKIKRISFIEIMENLKFTPKKTIIALLISIFSWPLTYLLLYFCFEIVNLDIPLITVLIMGPILTISRLFPLTFNGIGSDEYIIIYLFSSSKIMDEQILIAALIYRLVVLLIPAFFGLIIFFTTKKIDVKSK